ncbi:MAG: D-alanyl-D-alanine carboxypeptidase [Lachnospiraceae bacterium]|nr:D-alanyl-D-alanine carboxypeptidase [Lachnospiraceae bacterium]
MSEYFVDRETAEYQERRRERLAKREEHRRRQQERQKKIRDILFIVGGCIAALVLAVVIMLTARAIRRRNTAVAEDTSNISAENDTDGSYEGDARELLYEDDAGTGDKVDINQDGSGAASENSAAAGPPAMTELSEEEIEALKAEEAADLTTGAGPLELNTVPDQDTESIVPDVDSGYAILISLSENRVIAEKQAHERMYPASMTKVLTVLVAAEHLENEQHLDDIFTMTQSIEGFAYDNGCSNVGFSPGERVRVEDLFYGTILPSGADAAMGLAEYTAGNQESFVAMMNEKARELGIGDTSHFMNCIGIYDDNHYSTASDIAVIMNAAVNNPLCLEVLSRHTYTTTPTSYHPGGITVSNWFLRRIEDKMGTGEVLCGKTGYVKESLNCAVSYSRDDEGKGYICCTGYAHGGWQAIGDHVRIYTHEYDSALYNATLKLADTEEDDGGDDGV